MQPKTSDVLDLHTFSVSAIRALNMGVVIGRRYNARALNSEHLLLALLNQADGNANKILLHFGVDVFAVRAAAENYLALPSIAPPSDLYFAADNGQQVLLSSNLVLILDRARVIADRYRLAWVGTDHLLAALMAVEGPASAILKRFGVTSEQIDEALTQINGGKGNIVGEGNTSVVVDLVAAVREVQDHGVGDCDRGVRHVGVHALGRQRDPLLEVLDRSDRLVGVLELDQVVAEDRVGVIRVADLNRAPREVGEGERLRFGGHRAVRYPGTKPSNPSRLLGLGPTAVNNGGARIGGGGAPAAGRVVHFGLPGQPEMHNRHRGAAAGRA
jgi:hypothetical protein